MVITPTPDKKPTTKLAALKAFFGTPERPITNAELIDLRKEGQESYDELANAALATYELEA